MSGKQLSGNVVEAMARQFALRSVTIAQEMCDSVGAGSPSHPRLKHDVENAAFCALHSQTFRALVVAIEADALLGKLAEAPVAAGAPPDETPTGSVLHHRFDKDLGQIVFDLREPDTRGRV